MELNGGLWRLLEKNGMKKSFVLGGKVMVISFPTVEKLQECMARMEEFYEGPVPLNGEVNSLEKIKEVYKDLFNEDYSEYTGFNVPSSSILKFREKAQLTEAEERLLEDFGECLYLIGYLEGEEETTLKHELFHALFFIDEEFRDHCNLTVKKFNTGKIEKELAAQGYGENVIKEEVMAYSVACLEELMDDSPYKELRVSFNVLYATYIERYK